MNYNPTIAINVPDMMEKQLDQIEQTGLMLHCIAKDWKDFQYRHRKNVLSTIKKEVTAI